MLADAVDIAAQIGHRAEALAAEIRGRRGAEAQILVQVPVFQIVPRGKARLGEIGNFIVLIAVVAQDAAGREVHIRLPVIVRQIGAVAVVPQGRSLLDAQGVGREVVGLESQNVFDRFLPAGEGLVGQAIHQIDRHIGKADLARPLHRLPRLLIGVRAAELLEHLVVVGLDADGNAVEARAQEFFERLVRHAVGVGLERDLRVRVEAEAALDLVKDLLQILRAEETGRAAAEIDRIDHVLRRKAAGFLDMVGQRLQIVVGHMTVAAAAEGVEIAVFALALAEGDMHIDAQLFIADRALEKGKCHAAPPTFSAAR